LAKEDLAILPVFDMLAGLAAVCFSLGIHPTIIRNLPPLLKDDPEAARGQMYTSAVILVLGAAIFAILIFVFSPKVSTLLFHTDKYSSLLRIMPLGLFFAATRTALRYFLWASARISQLSIIEIVATLSRALFAVGLLLLFGLPGMVTGLVISEFLALCTGVYFLRDYLFGPVVRWMSPITLIRESFPFYMEGFLMYFRAQGDNWIVATFLGPEIMAVYFVAKRIPSLLLMFLESIDTIMTSELARRQTEAKEIRQYIYRIYLLSGHIIVPGMLFIIALSPAMTILIAGPAYTDAVLPCIILCLTTLVRILAGPVGRGVFLTHPPTTRVYLTVVETAVLILGLFLLAPSFLSTGVALSRLVSAFAVLLPNYILLKRSLDIGIPFRQFLLSLIASLIMLSIILLLYFWNTSLLLLPVWAVAGVGAFFLVVTLTNSRVFYETLNTISPFRVVDPCRWVIGRVAR
jgi:O-antigen/teichoic acid export membrane protein